VNVLLRRCLQAHPSDLSKCSDALARSEARARQRLQMGTRAFATRERLRGRAYNLLAGELLKQVVCSRIYTD